MYSTLTESERKLILFTYEKQSNSEPAQAIDLFDMENHSYILTEGEYILWELEKRKLTEAEVIAHSWLLTSKNCAALLLRFNRESHLIISSLFEQECYPGGWLLENGILKIHFNYKDHDYAIDVIANNNRLIHSALQVVDDSTVDIVKVVPVSGAKYGHALVE